jgi:hypothetical protein
MTGMNLVPLPFSFELGAWGQLHLIILFIGMYQTKFYSSRPCNTVLAMKRSKEARSHLPVALSCVCKGNQTLLKG